MASISEDKTIKIWDLNSKKCIHTFKSHTKYVTGITKIPNTNQIITTSDDCTIQCHDVATKEMIFKINDDAEIWAVLFLKNKNLAVG